MIYDKIESNSEEIKQNMYEIMISSRTSWMLCQRKD